MIESRMAWRAFAGKCARSLCFSALWALSCGGPDGEVHPQPKVKPVEGKPVGECGAVLRTYEGATATHLPECSIIDYATSPPVFGEHFPTWAAYKTYDFPVPLGFLVHDLEHGAVVFFYDCPEGCSDEVQVVQDFIDALPADPRCSSNVRVQVILVPRPKLGVRWAASSWGASLTADCFDPEVFGQFYEDHVAKGREDLCNQGVALTEDPCD